LKNQIKIEYLSEDLLKLSSNQTNQNYDIKIEFDVAYWFIENHNATCPIFIFNKKVEGRIALKKYDVITIGKRKLHWANHIIEKDQELSLKDLFRYNGRVNTSNFKFFIAFYTGVAFCIMFFAPLIPEFIFSILPNLGRKSYRPKKIELLTFKEKYAISMVLYVIFYLALMIALIFLIIKRIRDYKAEKAFKNGNRMI